MTCGALHFDLVVSVCGVSGKEGGFIFSLKKEIVAVASDGGCHQEPEEVRLFGNDPFQHQASRGKRRECGR